MGWPQPERCRQYRPFTAFPLCIGDPLSEQIATVKLDRRQSAASLRVSLVRQFGFAATYEDQSHFGSFLFNRPKNNSRGDDARGAKGEADSQHGIGCGWQGRGGGDESEHYLPSLVAGA